MQETGELSPQDAAEIAQEVHDKKKEGEKINAERIISKVGRGKCGICGRAGHTRWECPHFEAALAAAHAEMTAEELEELVEWLEKTRRAEIFSNGRDDCYCRRCGSKGSVNDNGKCDGCKGSSTGSSRYCRRCGSYGDVQSNGKCAGCKGHST